MNENKMIEMYKKRLEKKYLLVTLLFSVLLFFIFFCTSVGVTDSNMRSVLLTITKYLKNLPMETTIEKVIFNLRLPRTLLAVIAGIGLSISGGVMQGVTRNPLVSPFTVGISSAAAFGASLGIVYNIGFLNGSKWGVVLNAFTTALLCASLVFLLASKRNLTPSSLILTGIAMNYFFQALSTTIQYAANETKLAQVIAWTFGSVNGATWDEVIITFIITTLTLIGLLIQSNSLTILSTMDDDISKTMGINANRTRIICSLLSVVTTASIISFTGVIGFVGLAAPHISRTISGNDYKIFLPMTAITGALLVLLADTIGRTIFMPLIIPVGIVISFIGVPIFVHQVVLNNKKH